MHSRVFNTICKSVLMLPFLVSSYATYAAELEEIVVTAQKRSESLQEVPISRGSYFNIFLRKDLN